MDDAIINRGKIFDTLLGGFEVLMIRKHISTRYGISCEEMSKMPFEKIDEIVKKEENEPSTVVFVKTEKYDQKEGEEDEKSK